jgi:hypothetical protein
MEIERSLLFPQETAIGPYPETNKSDPHPPILFTYVSILILSSLLRLGLSSSLFPSDPPTRILY